MENLREQRIASPTYKPVVVVVFVVAVAVPGRKQSFSICIQHVPQQVKYIPASTEWKVRLIHLCAYQPVPLRSINRQTLFNTVSQCAHRRNYYICTDDL